MLSTCTNCSNNDYNATTYNNNATNYIDADCIYIKLLTITTMTPRGTLPIVIERHSIHPVYIQCLIHYNRISGLSIQMLTYISITH